MFQKFGIVLQVFNSTKRIAFKINHVRFYVLKFVHEVFLRATKKSHIIFLGIASHFLFFAKVVFNWVVTAFSQALK